MKNKFVHYILFLVVLIISSCRDYSPKPRGYPHFDLTQSVYQQWDQSTEFSFSLSEQSKILNKRDSLNYEWFDIRYPALDATIHCSYVFAAPGSFAPIEEESRKFVYFHVQKAQQFQEQLFENPEENMYGVVYKIEGNVASPLQFVLTDSIRSIFRAALYFDQVPNRDSIAPVVSYINRDIQTIIESFRWKR